MLQYLPLAALPLRPSLPQPSTEQVAVRAIAQSCAGTCQGSSADTHTAMQLTKSQLRAQAESDETEGRPPRSRGVQAGAHGRTGSVSGGGERQRPLFFSCWLADGGRGSD